MGITTGLSRFSRIKWERALALKKRGDYPAAEKELEEAIEEDPGHLLLKSSLADLYLRQGRVREARILTDAILSTDPEYPGALYLSGRILQKENRLEEALQCFRRAHQRDPGEFLVLKIAETLRRMMRYEEALELLDTIPESRRPSVLKEKAMLLARVGRLKEALRIYEDLHKRDPRDRFVRKELYRLRGKERPAEKVIREMETVLSLPSGKEDPQLHGYLAQRLKESGRLEEAAAAYGKASRLAPDNPYFLKQQGYCLNRMKDTDGAIRCLSEALRRDPGDYIARKTLGRLFAAAGNPEGFISLLEEIVEKNPHQVRLLGTLKKLKKQQDL